MKIKFWGVRGSLPGTASHSESKEQAAFLINKFFQLGFKSADDIPAFLKKAEHPDLTGYGVATTCVQIGDADQNIIVDGGSGIKFLSDENSKSSKKQTEFHILMTHFHFDHILGLPFFSPHFNKNCKIHYYSVQSECKDIVQGLFKKPIFPVGYEDLSAQISYNVIKPYEKIQVNGFNVTPYKLDHPDPCFGFRIEQNGLVYAHAVDTEAIRITETELGPDVGLYKDADLLYIDAQYLEEEMQQKKGWGHGTFERAFNLCNRYGVKQVLMAHYDPSAGIKDIQKFKDKATDAFKDGSDKDFQKMKTDWSFAFEGQTVEIKK